MFLKLDSLLHKITSAGKLFQETVTASDKHSICSRHSQQWTCGRTCLAGGGSYLNNSLTIFI